MLISSTGDISTTNRTGDRRPAEATASQRRFLEEKYLRGMESVESWLGGVAHNLALAEVLYHPNAFQWGLFAGVRLHRREIPAPPASRIQGGPEFVSAPLFHTGIDTSSERTSNFQRFLKNAEKATQIYPEAREVVAHWEQRFYEQMRRWRFLPNEVALQNAAKDIQQLQASFVLDVEDSLEGITCALRNQALIHKSGGGTGLFFGGLRPAGDPLKTGEGVASGAVAFSELFDKMAAAVNKGAPGRGSNLMVLPYWHPEIREFLRMKRRPGLMENVGMCVSLDAHFWDAYHNDREYDLLNPRTLQPLAKASARDVFRSIVESIWKRGEPSVLFTDHVQSSASHPTPALGEIEGVSPSGGEPLLANESCSLGALSLPSFVVGSIGHSEIQWDELKEAIGDAVRLLDNMIDVNNYPSPETESAAKATRRIGLGVMGWAETLTRMGLPYDSEDAFQMAEKVMSFIRSNAWEASEKLAHERGVFPAWKNSVFDPSGTNFRGDLKRSRHATTTALFNTETLSLIVGVGGRGIDPFTSIAHTRYNASGIEAIRAQRAPAPDDLSYEVNGIFRLIAEQHHYFGLTEKGLWEKIERNHRSIRGIEEIPLDIQRLFLTSADVMPEHHLRMQTMFQRHTDNAVAKTVYVPHAASLEHVSQLIVTAHENHCKSVSIYREGSRKEQILQWASSQKNRRERILSTGMSSDYYEIKTGHGPVHVHIDYDEQGPYRVFATLSPIGTELSGLTSLTGVLISKYLENGGNPAKLLRHLSGVKGDRPVGLGDRRIESIPHAIANALKMHLVKHNGWEESAELELDFDAVGTDAENQEAVSAALELWTLVSAGDRCPQCFSSHVSVAQGMSGPICHDCGSTEF